MSWKANNFLFTDHNRPPTLELASLFETLLVMRKRQEWNPPWFSIWESMQSLLLIMIVNSKSRPCSKCDLKLVVMISFSGNVRIIMRAFYTFHISNCIDACVCVRRKSPLYHDSIRHNHSHNSVVKLLWRILFILLGFVCLSTPFDLHVVLKYTKCCLHHTMMTLHSEQLFFLFD